jgi:hypothetical protein
MAQQPGTTGLKKAVRPAAFRVETTQRRERYLKLLIYGNFGVGKTYLAGSAAEVASMRDVLIINAEAGDLSLTAFEGIDEITVKDFKTLGQINEYLKQHCKAREEGDIERLKELESAVRGVDVEDIDKPRQYHTVIIDSLTELEAYCFNQLLGITDTTRLDEDPESAEWTEYKKNHTMMQRVVRAFRDLPMHVIFTASEQFQQDESKRYKYSPDLTGKLSKKIQGFMDMVGYLAIGKDGEKTIRRLYVSPSPTGKYDAKHRYQAFSGEFFLNPSIKKILFETKLADKDGVPLN